MGGRGGLGSARRGPWGAGRGVESVRAIFSRPKRTNRLTTTQNFVTFPKIYL